MDKKRFPLKIKPRNIPNEYEYLMGDDKLFELLEKLESLDEIIQHAVKSYIVIRTIANFENSMKFLCSRVITELNIQDRFEEEISISKYKLKEYLKNCQINEKFIIYNDQKIKCESSEKYLKIKFNEFIKLKNVSGMGELFSTSYNFQNIFEIQEFFKKIFKLELFESIEKFLKLNKNYLGYGYDINTDLKEKFKKLLELRHKCAHVANPRINNFKKERIVSSPTCTVDVVWAPSENEINNLRKEDLENMMISAFIIINLIEICIDSKSSIDLSEQDQVMVESTRITEILEGDFEN
jgi:hypothetical protein